MTIALEVAILPLAILPPAIFPLYFCKCFPEAQCSLYSARSLLETIERSVGLGIEHLGSSVSYEADRFV